MTRSLTDEELLRKRVGIDYAMIELKRNAGCMCLDYETEERAIDILKEMKREKYSTVDEFKAIFKAIEETGYELHKKCFVSASGFTEADLDRVKELASQDS